MRWIKKILSRLFDNNTSSSTLIDTPQPVAGIETSNALTCHFWSAEGGIVLEIYDNTSNNNRHKSGPFLYIVTDTTQLGSELEKILFRYSLNK